MASRAVFSPLASVGLAVLKALPYLFVEHVTFSKRTISL